MDTITYDGRVYSCPFKRLAPPLTPDQRAGLAADITRNEIRVPVIITDAREVIDGHHRLTIAAEMKLPGVRFDVQEGMSDADKLRLAVALNVHRRHVDPAGRRRLIEAHLTCSPERSNRDIAAGVGASHNTVQSAWERLEATGRIDQLAATTGRDGKTRPAMATRPKKPPAGDTPAAKTSPTTDGPRWSSLKAVAGEVDNLARRVRSASNRPLPGRNPSELRQLAGAPRRQADELESVADTLPPADEGVT